MQHVREGMGEMHGKGVEGELGFEPHLLYIWFSPKVSVYLWFSHLHVTTSLPAPLCLLGCTRSSNFP